LNNINLNKSKIQHCETVLDLRNSFEEMYEVTIYFDVTHMTDFRNKIYEKIILIILEKFS